jgi:hypothetical protein
MRTPNFSFLSKEESVLEYIEHVYFPVYSIDVVLYAYVNECTPMIGLSRLDLSFLEA